MLKILLPIALAAGLLFFFYQSYQESKPEAKNSRVYTELQEFIPYSLEKRFGGLTILSTKNDIKEKPPASQIFHRLDALEKLWGKTHLKLDGNSLTVLGDDNKTVKTITLQNESEIAYIKNFFGL
ncbi:MAG TPA: hypothetical protein EYH01_09390 [Campylobacterales bacterium]|nr:hypothetical protein [Campylobacterales bacterium]